MDLTGYVPDDLHGPIPRDLALLVSLLNTAGIDGGFDQLADLEGLAVWLGPDSSTGATAADLEAARQLRAALRALAASNCGERTVYRSWPPFPCSTRIVIRAESRSAMRRWSTSFRRRPAA